MIGRARSSLVQRVKKLERERGLQSGKIVVHADYNGELYLLPDNPLAGSLDIWRLKDAWSTRDKFERWLSWLPLDMQRRVFIIQGWQLFNEPYTPE